MAKTSVPATASNAFARLAQLASSNSNASKAEGEDDDASKAEGEDDDEAKKKAEDDKKKDDEAKAAKKAEDDKKKDDDAKKAEDDKKKDDDAKSKSKDGDDDSDEDDKKDKDAKAARGREKGRIKAIVSSAAGIANPAMAVNLALNTSMSRGEALALLEGMPAQASSEKPKDPLRERMSTQPNPDIGTGGGTAPEANLAQKIIAADAKRRGETPPTK